MRNRKLLFVVFFGLGIIGGIFVVSQNRIGFLSLLTGPKLPVTGDTIQPRLFATSAPSVALLKVPFVSQAPLGEWDDPRQQDGCEEATSLMAMLWVEGKKKPSPQETKAQLLEISDYEQQQFGSYHDTSVKDTVERIFKGYFHYENVRAVYNITVEDIKRELANGNLVIIPADGRKLGNPYYTQPGPERHNLVIRGYDSGKREFITNDNGTRRGEGYRYNEQVLFEAIRDYPTGDHVPISDVQNKAMIVVSPH